MSITNLNSEKYFRQACDYFYFLDNPKLALKCIEKVLNINPKHHKAVFLKGEIMLYIDDVEEALNCFLEFNEIVPSDFHNLANIAMCFEMLEDWTSALEYCNSAIENFNDNEEKDFLSSLYELKISLLVKTENKILARQTLDSLSSVLFTDGINRIKSAYGFLRKIKKPSYLKLVR